MAVNLTNADNALKSYYLDAITEQLKYGVGPFFAAIKNSTEDVWGKDVRKLVTYGLNGGIGAGSEDGGLPTASSNNYRQIVSTLKNLYGTIEISDKAIRASENNAGAFVSLLNAEMEGLIKASAMNFERMLMGNGNGKIAMYVGFTDGYCLTDNTDVLQEGMIVDFRTESGEYIEGATGKKIINVDRSNGRFMIDSALPEEGISIGSMITVQGSYGNEITGLDAIFDMTKDELYGLKRSENSFLNPYIQNLTTDFNEIAIQNVIDNIERRSGSTPNFIMCSWGVRRALQKLFSTNRSNVDVTELKGGYKAMTYNGIPIVVSKYCAKGCMYFLNTDDFTLHQLCDWQWLSGDDGKVLKQVAGKPVYTATLVKYAELICSRPCGQGLLKGITEM